MWYGVSNIAARLLTYLLTPYFLTVAFVSEAGKIEFGKYSFIYAAIPLLNVLFTYGMETAFFRYSQTEDKKALYRTQLSAMLVSTLLFTGVLLLFTTPLSHFANVENHPEYIGWCAAIIGLDAISALPYARLRNENRPRKYAATKVIGIVVYVVSIVALFSFGDDLSAISPAFAAWYKNHWGVGFILFANILQAAATLLLLAKELKDYKPFIDSRILKQALLYGGPILITGFAGTINDTLNRIMFQKLYPVPEAQWLKMLGMLNAAIRLSIMINLAIQAFKMAAEPFFFSMSKEQGAQQTYARVMKWFVIALCIMFLGVVLFMDVWKHFIGNYTDAIHLVPVLLMSYVFLGIYYNLTVWYKLTDRTVYGMYIMIIGAAVTVAINWLMIPLISYDACAWGMLICNGLMMVLSYTWGQKFYPIPYETSKMLRFMGVMLACFGVAWVVNGFIGVAALRLLLGVGLMGVFLLFIYRQERAELSGIAAKLKRK